MFEPEFTITRIVEAYDQEITRKDIQNLVYLLKSFNLCPKYIEEMYYNLFRNGPFSKNVAATINGAVTLGLLNEYHVGSNWYYTVRNVYDLDKYTSYESLPNTTIEIIQYLKKFDLHVISSIRFLECEDMKKSDIINNLDYILKLNGIGFKYYELGTKILRRIKDRIDYLNFEYE